MDVLIQNRMFLDILQRQIDTVRRNNRSHHRLTHNRQSSRFVIPNVRTMIAQDGMRRAGKVHTKSELVAHRTRRDEEGGFVSEKMCDVRFKRGGVGVFEVDVVA